MSKPISAGRANGASNSSSNCVELMYPDAAHLITSIAGVSFERAWAGRTQGSIERIPVQFVGL
jgi:hypothetical protein